jgi:hypothetical protein
MLDTVLCVMKGRPPTINDTFCTTPLPIPYREGDFTAESIVQLIADQTPRNKLIGSLLPLKEDTSSGSETSTDHPPASLGSTKCEEKEIKQVAQFKTDAHATNIPFYFLYAVDLTIIMRETIKTLYAPGAATQSWLEMETTISNLKHAADSWLSCLPEEFHFNKSDSGRPFAPQRTSLAFLFYATKLLISQPCHSRLAYEAPSTAFPRALCDNVAAICVQVAGQIVELLPNKPEISWIYTVSPWWCVLHYVMQSTTILLVELFTHTQPRTPKATVLMKNIQKAILWLREMSKNDPSSQRAWLLCMDIISRHGSKFAFTGNIGL